MAAYGCALPEFEFLLEEMPRYCNKQLEWKDATFGIVKKKQPAKTRKLKSETKEDPPMKMYSATLTAPEVQELLDLDVVQESNVGKGRETVYDPEVRSSHEVLGKFVVLSEPFENMLRKEVAALSAELCHPCHVEPRLHKLVLYQKDDLFSSHMDAPHTGNMVMTLSVQLYVNSTNGEESKDGGELVMDMEQETMPNATASQNISMTLFYHDQMHSVNRLQSGYRVTLVFDVLHDGNALIGSPFDAFINTFNKGILKLKKHKTRRVGMLLRHKYISDDEQVAFTQLKGMDRTMAELFRRVCKANTVKVIHVCIEINRGIYARELLPVMQLSESFRALLHYREEEEDLDADNEIDQQHLLTTLEPSDYNYYRGERLKTDVPQMRWDEKGEYKAIASNYLLGDVVFLASLCHARKDYEGSEEVHLGNEGFDGEIYSDLAVVGELL